jgi:hypothetical protein
MLRRCAPWAVSLTLVVIGPAAGSHPEATLKAARSVAAAGTALPVTGEHFAANGKVLLALRGALGEYRLAEVTATGEGTLALSLDIPADVRPGRYQLIAVADDGDVVARLELTMEPPAGDSRESAAGGEDAMANRPVAGEHDTMARADDMPIERSRNGMEWGIIGLVVGLAGGLGLGLLRRPV